MDEFNHDPGKDKNEKKYINKIKKVLTKLIDKDGFYIILFICVCILGTIAVWVATQDSNEISNVDESNSNDLDVTEDYDLEPSILEDYATLPDFNDVTGNEDTNQGNTASEVEDYSEVEGVNIEKPTQTKEDNQQVENGQETMTSSAQVGVSQNHQSSKAISMILPTNGNITKKYAMDKLVYSKTLEQWTTHNGVDITAREGSVVRAALDGVVASVKNDDELGIVITIDHGEGLTTVYACLSTSEMVKVGQSVKKSETISGVGKGIGFELAQGPHLHFEVLRDGENVDPTQYIPNMR